MGRQGGITLILKGMSSHLSSPELVKSACGALSNMCQNAYNQNLIAAHGGVRYVRWYRQVGKTACCTYPTLHIPKDTAFNTQVVRIFGDLCRYLILHDVAQSGTRGQPVFCAEPPSSKYSWSWLGYGDTFPDFACPRHTLTPSPTPICFSLARTLLSALQSHRMNAPLLPFVFDALASLIVGNQVRRFRVTIEERSLWMRVERINLRVWHSLQDVDDIDFAFFPGVYREAASIVRCGLLDHSTSRMLWANKGIAEHTCSYISTHHGCLYFLLDMSYFVINATTARAKATTVSGGLFWTTRNRGTDLPLSHWHVFVARKPFNPTSYPLMYEKQRNGLLVTDGGGIRGVLTTMALHSGRREVVKSGCHTLAILSDIQGQGARIAGADGVKVPRGGAV